MSLNQYFTVKCGINSLGKILSGGQDIYTIFSTSTNPIVYGSTCVCSPIICGTNIVCAPTVCGSTVVCGPTVCGGTIVCSPTVCGSTAVCGGTICGSTSVNTPLLSAGVVCGLYNVIGGTVCGTTAVNSPSICGTTTVCGPTICGSTAVNSPSICGTTTVCGPTICGSTAVNSPSICGTTTVCGPTICGSTAVNTPLLSAGVVCGLYNIIGGTVCGTTAVNSPSICGTTTVCSPTICGSTAVNSPSICGTTTVCSPTICGGTIVCSPTICGSNFVCGATLCGTTAVNTPLLSAGAVCGLYNVISPTICGTTAVNSPSICGTTTVCGATICGSTAVNSPSICGTTSVCSPTVCGGTIVCSPTIYGTTTVCGGTICATTALNANAAGTSITLGSNNGSGKTTICSGTVGNIDNITIGANNCQLGYFTCVLASSGYFSNGLTVGGNLTVAGTATFLYQNDLVINEPIIYIAQGQPYSGVNSNIFDIGIVGHFNGNLTNGGPANTYNHTGLLRKAGQNSPGIWTLFSGLTTEPLSSINWNDPYIVVESLSANLSGTAAQATKLQYGRSIGFSGDVTATATTFDGSQNITIPTSITSLPYSKLANATKNYSVLGNNTGSTGAIIEIPASGTGFNILSAASVQSAAAAVGLGSTNSVTFNDVTTNNGTKGANNAVFTVIGSTTNPTVVSTFNKSTYNTAKYVVQVQQTTTGKLSSAACEILVTYDTSTLAQSDPWIGTVYSVLDSGNLLSNVQVSTTGSTIDLSFTFSQSNNNWNVIVAGQALSV